MTTKQLKAIRISLGLSRAGLAERMGLDRSSLSRMESGDQVITRSMEILLGYIAREAQHERQHQRSAHPSGHEKAGLGRARHVRQLRRKQQDPDQDTERRNPAKARRALSA